ncbi:unnamed protein product [Anisakis simplex]|uniref:Vitellogenin domain-containing protein n=1 Tax=Anisakis simplex TaxID=6269 RepID=A0A0M3K1Y0_ANISI|nr:unnamed protein product [Anisakis simplex]
MKLLILLCVCVLAVTARQSWVDVEREKIDDQYYQAGREYVYLYNGQLSAGVPEESDSHSSTRYEAVFSLTFPEDEHNAVFCIKHVRFASRNGGLAKHREVQPFEAFDEIKLSEGARKALTAPLRFKYDDGVIGEIEFDGDDADWSENIKRSILNLIQINMKKGLQKESREDDSSEEKIDINKEENANFYVVHERTMEGDCETTYTFNKSPRDDSDIMRITKSINYNKCTKRVDLRYNHRFAQPKCGHCELNYDKEDGLMPSTAITYEVLGNREKFLIKNADIKTDYIFSPLNPKDLVLETFSTGTLRLLKVKSLSEVVMPMNGKTETLLYIPLRVIRVERFIMVGDEELDEKHVYSHVKYKYELAEQMVRRIARATSNPELGVEPEAAHQLARLVELFRSCTSKDVQLISDGLFDAEGKFDKKTHQKIRDIILDGWSIVSTYETMYAIVQKIQNRQVSTLKAVKTLHNIMLNDIAISEKQVDLIMGLCTHEVSERNPMLRQGCLLTVGGMISGLCARINDEQAVDSTENRCPLGMKQKYHRMLIELYRNANTRYEKLLALRVIGNAGLDLSVYELEKIIKDRSQERIYRVQAIDSLRRLRPVMPRKVQKILMPLFKDRTEHPEIRIAAIVQVMHTLPDRSILDQIAQALYYETSRHVLTFVSTMLQSFEKSENPCEKQLAEDLAVALRLVHVDTTRWSDSKYMHMPVYSEAHKAGVTFDFATIFANDSILPRHSIMSFDTLQFGQWRKETAQLGFIQYHLEQLIEKLMATIERTATRHHSTRSGPAQILRSLYEGLKIRSRREEAEAHALLYVRRFGMDLALVPLDAETLPELFTNGEEIDIDRFIARLTRGYHFSVYFGHFSHENYHKLPTTVGIPLHFCSKMPTVIGLEGDVKLSFEPEQFANVRSIKLDINVRPAFTAAHLAEMYSVNPINMIRPKMIQLVKVNLPINARLEVNFGQKTEVKWIWKVPDEKKQILLAQTRTVTSTSNPRNSKTFIEPKDKTAHLKNQIHHVISPEKTIGKNWLGALMHIRGQWHENAIQMLKETPVAFLAGENELEVTIEKDRDAPTNEIVTKFEFELLRNHKMTMKHLKDFYSDDEYERKVFASETKDEHTHTHRYGRDGRMDQDEYEPSKGHKLRIHMEIETIGSTSKRAADMEILTGCDDRARYCEVDINARRNPIYENERRDWTMRARAEQLYPEAVRSMKDLSGNKPRHMIAKVHAEWGSDKKQKMKVKIQAGQSAEQKSLVERISDTMPIAQHHKDVTLAAQLNEYKFLAEYKVEQHSKHCLNNMLTMLRSWNIWNSYSEYVENPDNKLYAKLTVNPEKHHMVNLALHTPTEHVKLHDLKLPMNLYPYVMEVHQPVTHADSFTRFLKRLLANDRAECRITSRRVDTFDDVEINMPLTTCYSVLAKDCRSDNPKFAVLMRKLKTDSEEMRMKIINEEQVIELEPIRDEIEVKVDGTEMTDDERLQELGIEKRDDMVTVELEDVKVRFDGRTASIKLSPLFKNGQCGICGDYDGEKIDELRTADNALTDDLEEYSRSYLHQDDECSIEEDVIKEKKYYKLDDDVDEWLDDDEEDREEHQIKIIAFISEPIKRTKIIEHNFEVCFSMTPVLQCPEKSYALSDMKVNKKVAFTCIPRTDHQATKLIYRSRFETLDMSAYTKSFVEEIVIPEGCRTF